MKNFLEKIAEEVQKSEKPDQLAVIFPSRRAGLHFKKVLAVNSKTAFWSPTVFSIEDFIYELTTLKNPGQLKLLFELFSVYRKFSQKEEFGAFFQWGEIILNDFDTIDKSMANASEVFRNIRELKTVDEQFQLEFADTPYLNRFWSSFSTKQLSSFQEQHIRTWEILGKVYKEFKINLKKKNLAYDGMVYREAAENIRSIAPGMQWQKIIFAGFNALSKSEKTIMAGLIATKEAVIFHDADKYYLEDENQEAGKFIRGNSKFFDTNNWVDDCFSDKNVTIAGAPLNVSQAKVLSNLLHQVKISGREEKTALIVPDPALLIPILSSIPENIAALNVTMGFPLKNTVIFNLLKQLNNLQTNKKPGQEVLYYHEDVLKILSHPYVKQYNPELINRLVGEIKKNNIVYVAASRILRDSGTPEILRIIFNPVDEPSRFFDYYNSILGIVARQMQAELKGNEQARFELEFIYNLILNLNTFKNLLEEYELQIDTITFTKLFDNLLRPVKVPFSGEPLKGLQIMGLLESRCLDFDNVFILSMNEDIVPAGNSQATFIPYALRKAFGIPTFEDDDANTAYYVYRLVQKANNVFLIYNTEPGKIFTGEKSRFLLQMENELRSYNKNIRLKHLIYTSVPSFAKLTPISITKSPEVLNKLKSLPHLSQTDIASYINCPLQFYFRKIAGLEEEEILEEYFSPATFGNILHEIMKILYGKYKGKQVVSADIKNIRKYLNANYDELLKEAFSGIDELKESDINQSGKNFLYKNIIRTLVNLILDNDSKLAPFTIEEVETSYEHTVKLNLNGEAIAVKLKGKFDRVDFKDGYYRIVDYKTGTVYMTYDKKAAEVFNSKDFKFQKTFFQTYFYAYLFNQSQKTDNIKVSIYPLKKIIEGTSEKDVAPGDLSVFNEKINELLQKIYNPQLPFDQTEHLDNCSFCAYRRICYR